MTAQLANGGFKINPKIIVDNNQNTLDEIKFQMAENAKKDKNILSNLEVVEDLFNIKKNDYQKLYEKSENIKIVLDAMFGSTNETWGTSYSSRIEDPKYQFAGKTGTAQVKRISERARELDLKTEDIKYQDRDHALYVAFGPYKNPRYALSIIVEHGGSGSSTAAPIAKKLFKLIIDRHELREQSRNKKSKVT
jgi:penicillin-binding protein 2